MNPVPYLVTITGCDPPGALGRVLARLPATSPADALATFRTMREVPTLEPGVRLDAAPASVYPEHRVRDYTWTHRGRGVYLYDPGETAARIATYARDRRGRTAA
jgi:hypothetical protein